MERKSYDKYINLKFGKLTIIDVYRNEKGRIAKCKCECGETKEIYFYNVINGKSKSCGCFERESRYNRKHAKTSVIEQRFNRLVVLRDSGKRAPNGGVMWECKCDCGNITYVNSSNLKRGHTKSCGCAIDDYVDTLKIDIIGKKFNHLTVIKELDRSEYKRRTYLCKCDCGKEVAVSGDSLTGEHTMSCGCIRRSHGELLVKSVLDNHNIPYIEEYRFADCKNIRCLPFDFYLPTQNICIEYHGRQHYENVDYWGGEKDFIKRKERDKIKKNYCVERGIKYIEIPYSTPNENVESMILNVLNP